jgi:hypothetical protein
MAGVSRTDLLQWLNDLLQINYTKVEQCGTGAAYCQIFDSIYGKFGSSAHLTYRAIPPPSRTVMLLCYGTIICALFWVRVIRIPVLWITPLRYEQALELHVLFFISLCTGGSGTRATRKTWQIRQQDRPC